MSHAIQTIWVGLPSNSVLSRDSKMAKTEKNPGRILQFWQLIIWGTLLFKISSTSGRKNRKKHEEENQLLLECYVWISSCSHSTITQQIFSDFCCCCFFSPPNTLNSLHLLTLALFNCSLQTTQTWMIISLKNISHKQGFVETRLSFFPQTDRFPHNYSFIRKLLSVTPFVGQTSLWLFLCQQADRTSRSNKKFERECWNW